MNLKPITMFIALLCTIIAGCSDDAPEGGQSINCDVYVKKADDPKCTDTDLDEERQSCEELNSIASGLSKCIAEYNAVATCLVADKTKYTCNEIDHPDTDDCDSSLKTFEDCVYQKLRASQQRSNYSPPFEENPNSCP